MGLTAKTYNHILKAGTQAAYNAIDTKDASTLYFCTDTGKLYKGSVDFTDNLVAVASKPTTPVAGKIYFISGTNTVEAYVGGAWKVISYPVATDVDDESDDVHVASAKAVYDAIQAAVAELADSADIIKDIDNGDDDGTLVITKGDDTTSDLTINGVVTTPTWNASTRVLTLPVNGGSSVEVNIGKDIFLDPSKEQKYNPATGNIELFLNDGDDSTDATMISIPASSLVNDYSVADTNSVDLTLDGSTHQITASVKLNSSTSNAISVDANGLMVDLSDYATTEYVDGEVDTLETSISGLQTSVGTLETAVETLNGDDETAGSVAYQIAQSNVTINAAIDAVDAKADANAADILVLDSNMTALATAALGWGTF